jgi:UDP-N-acetylmuramyl pentapeptide phosphotransferase/UDP-N-acetylglucosamine-1-phosphate transferase
VRDWLANLNAEDLLAPWLCAAGAAALVVGLGERANRSWYGWLPDDPPRPGRKQHGRPVPLAGVVLVLVGVPWCLVLQAFWLAAAAAVAGGIGYLDDRGKEHGRDLDWRWKALGLWAAAGLAAADACDPLAAPGAFAGLWLLGFVLTNATNFLDNTDGVCAALAAASLLGLSGGAGAGGALAGLALGFLPWNWPRARVFLGDAGAYLLGIGTAWALGQRLQAGGLQPLWAVLVQLLDFTQVVLARLWLGVPPWVGDRRHLTHIAQHLGLDRRWVAPLFGLVAAALAVASRC